MTLREILKLNILHGYYNSLKQFQIFHLKKLVEMQQKA